MRPQCASEQGLVIHQTHCCSIGSNSERPSLTQQTIIDLSIMALVAAIDASVRFLRCERDVLGLTPEALAQSASHQVQTLIQTVRATPIDVPDATAAMERISVRRPGGAPSTVPLGGED